MKVGQLNRRVSIMAQTGTDTRGRIAGAWSPVFTTWASIDMHRSMLLYEPSEFVTNAIYMITIRWRRSPIISSANQLQYVDAASGQVHNYEIRAVLNPNERNRQIDLMCYELGGAE